MVVRGDGSPASGLKVLARALIAWSPVLLLVTLRIIRGNFLPNEIGSRAATSPLFVATVAIGVLFFALAIGSALLPGRGIPDRLSGTWLVPR